MQGLDKMSEAAPILYHKRVGMLAAIYFYV